MKKGLFTRKWAILRNRANLRDWPNAESPAQDLMPNSMEPWASIKGISPDSERIALLSSEGRSRRFWKLAGVMTGDGLKRL